MIYHFADCTLDTERHRLLRAGEEVHVEPQVFTLLRLLVEGDGALVSRDTMIEEIWRGRIVSEGAIDSRIRSARVAVGDDGRRQSVIRTVTRHGVQLAVEVARDGAVAARPAEARQTVRLTRSADGTGLAWAESGRGPALMRAGHWLSHLELDWQSPVWRPLLDRLGADHRLLRYDQRGTGLSERAVAEITVETCVDDMKAVADAAGAEDFFIFAVSQSVPVSIAFAARYPERVRAMVLYGGFVEGSGVRDRHTGEAETETLVQLVRQGWGQPGSAFMTALSTLFMPEATSEQMDSFIEMQLASATPDGAAALRRAVGEFDVTDRLAQVRCPVLVVHSERDAVQPFAQGRRLAQDLPDARFLALETASHVILPQSPCWERLLSATGAFFEEMAER